MQTSPLATSIQYADADGSRCELLRRPCDEEDAEDGHELVDWQWARDGQSIVFAQMPGDGCDVHVETVRLCPQTKPVVSINLPGQGNAQRDLELVRLSAHAEYVASRASYPKLHTFIHSASGAFVLLLPSAAEQHFNKEDLLKQPIWHPDKPIIEYFSGGQVLMHDVESKEARYALEVPVLPQHVEVRQVQAWSPDGSLLCLHFIHNYQSMERPGTVIVGQAGTKRSNVFQCSTIGLVSAELSQASSALLCICSVRFQQRSFERRVILTQYSGLAISIYDLLSGTVIFNYDLPDICAFTRSAMRGRMTFLFSGSSIMLKTVSPDQTRLSGYSGWVTDDDESKFIPRGQTCDIDIGACRHEGPAILARLKQLPVGEMCLINMRSHEVHVLDASLLKGISGCQSLIAACNCIGDRLILTGAQVSLLSF